MLREIYDYGNKKAILSPSGFKLKQVKAYISLDSKGNFIGIDIGLKEKKMCPDVGSLAQGQYMCNILVEKAGIILLVDDSYKSKHDFFITALEKGSNYEPLFNTCLVSLKNEITRSLIIQSLETQKIKISDVIGFKVNMFPIEESENYLEWWNSYRKTLLQNKDSEATNTMQRCFITGNICEPVKTVPKINGLFSVGGHSSGDSLICFDKDAYRSYNLEQAENCPVSEEAINKINFTLEKLISDAPTHAGSKFVYWYKESLPCDGNYDLLSTLKDLAINENEDLTVNTDIDGDDFEQEITALINAKKLINSVKKGEMPQQLLNRYYILTLSGAGGRIMIRNYMEGSYEELYDSFKSWFDDLTLVNAKRPPKLTGIYIRLLKYQKSKIDLFKRISQELAGLDNQIMYAILKNTRLPDAVASRALNYIRSDLLSNEDRKKSKSLDSIACRILKVWLMRKEMFDKKIRREDVIMKEELNEENTNSAYLAGRMMAVYAKIQEDSLGDVGAGVVQRYYTSASTAPALVIGRLSALSQHHLGKLSKGKSIYYTNILADIASKVKNGFPRSMNIEQQSLFALGYYQQIADLYKKKDKEENKEEAK